MKMSDAFELPIHYDSGNDCLIESDGTPCGQLCTDTLQECVAHAVNHHDELVDALDSAIELIAKQWNYAEAGKSADISGWVKERAVELKSILEKAK